MTALRIAGEAVLSHNHTPTEGTTPMTRQPYFHPHPLMRHMQQATPERRHRHSMQYAALCAIASIAAAVVSVIAIVGWLS